MRLIGALVAAPVMFAASVIGQECGASKLTRWWRERDKNRRALAALEDDDVGDLSDIGRQARREARQG